MTKSKTRIIYEVRDGDNRRWREIDPPLPSSIVGQHVRRPGDTWVDAYGWEYRAREVSDNG